MVLTSSKSYPSAGIRTVNPEKEALGHCPSLTLPSPLTIVNKKNSITKNVNGNFFLSTHFANCKNAETAVTRSASFERTAKCFETRLDRANNELKPFLLIFLWTALNGWNYSTLVFKAPKEEKSRLIAMFVFKGFEISDEVLFSEIGPELTESSVAPINQGPTKALSKHPFQAYLDTAAQLWR